MGLLSTHFETKTFYFGTILILLLRLPSVFNVPLPIVHSDMYRSIRHTRHISDLSTTDTNMYSQMWSQQCEIRIIGLHETRRNQLISGPIQRFIGCGGFKCIGHMHFHPKFIFQQQSIGFRICIQYQIK